MSSTSEPSETAPDALDVMNQGGEIVLQNIQMEQPC
jgi:hypothetical protein